MSNYLVCKETEEGAYLTINGQIHFISNEHDEYGTVLDIVDQYNSTHDVAERDQLLHDLEELFTSPLYSELAADDRFEIDPFGQLYYKGISTPIPGQLAEMMRAGFDSGINVEPYINFWKNLAANPDKAVQSQLFGFLEHNGHPITKYGYFLAYKAVNVKRHKNTVEISDDEQPVTQDTIFTSIASGPYGGTIIVGTPVRMPREQCDSDPNVTCSRGLHVGSMEYVGDFGYENSVILEVLVNPRNVVAVPTDYNNTKMRVCEYYPFAISNGENNHVYLESDYKTQDDEQKLKDLEQFETEKLAAIAALEEELEEKKRLLGGII